MTSENIFLDLLSEVLLEPSLDKTLRARIKLLLASRKPREDDGGREL